MEKNKSSIPVRILEFLGAFCMCVILVLVFVDVFARYVFSAPIGGAPEIVAFGMGFTVFAAFSLVTRDRAHITVGIFEKFFTGAGRYFQRLFILLYTLLFVAFMCWLMVRQANTMRRTNYLSEYMTLPMAPIIYILAGFAGLAFVFLVPVIWRYLREGGDIEPEKKMPVPK